jgi:2,4-dichlorophenol 6-monooxygenase
MTWGNGIARQADYLAASPSQMCNLPQHLLEPLIHDAATERGADLRFSTELTAISQDTEFVHAVVRDRSTGEQYRIRARYAIGADGGRSTVAEQLGFPLDGEHGLGAAVNVWLEADLTKYTAHRPGVLYWISQPGTDFWVGSGTWICVRPWTEWVMLFMYDPADGEADVSEEALVARAHDTIGDPTVEVRIKSVGKWQINHVVATEYRRGRVFLAGDAAHRHPPANGLGTNTSIQDSYNLAWKLALVLRGRAGPALLDSYHDERQPVGRQVVDRAMKSVGDMLPIAQALGFTQGQSADDGWASMAELFSATPTGARRRTELDAAIELQNYQFNTHGVELSRRYASGAVADDGTLWPVPPRDPELYYDPTTHPGAALPHAWLQHGTDRVSTLDLAGHGRFCLITGIGGEDWDLAAAKAAAELDMDLPAYRIGARCEYDDVYGEWARAREIGDGGALLVRPDRHIAWRASEPSDDPATDLLAALRRVLSLNASSDAEPQA